MDLTYRPIEEQEFAEFRRADLIGFAADPARPMPSGGIGQSELERTCAAFDGTAVVGAGRNYSLELTLPGGVCVPAGAVSWVSVLPTHRRRGVLTEILRRLLDDSRARGESSSILHASEALIYGRFGYGVATQVAGWMIDRRHAGFAAEVHDPGRIRMVDDATAERVLPEIFQSARATRPGEVSRPAPWWVDQFFFRGPDESDPRFIAVHETPEGRADGYVAYTVSGDWGDDGVPDKKVRCFDHVARDPGVQLALWRFLLDLDLATRVEVWPAAVDDPLRWRLRDLRRLRVDTLHDRLWLRPLDITALLAQRRYLVRDALVLEVVDPFLPDVGGRFLLDAGPDGAECVRTDRRPDLVLDVAALGAVCLGANRVSLLAAAGLVHEQERGAAPRADLLLAAERIPHTTTWF